MKFVEFYNGRCGFEKLFSKNVPHVLEKIFLYLDYESFKACPKVNKAWNELLTSESFQKKAESVFKIGIQRDIERLMNACWRNKTNEVEEILSCGMVGVDSEGQDGSTPLSVAVCHASNRVVQLLLQRGADPNKSGAQFN